MITSFNEIIQYGILHPWDGVLVSGSQTFDSLNEFGISSPKEIFWHATGG